MQDLWPKVGRSSLQKSEDSVAHRWPIHGPTVAQVFSADFKFEYWPMAQKQSKTINIE